MTDLGTERSARACFGTMLYRGMRFWAPPDWCAGLGMLGLASVLGLGACQVSDKSDYRFEREPAMPQAGAMGGNSTTARAGEIGGASRGGTANAGSGSTGVSAGAGNAGNAQGGSTPNPEFTGTAGIGAAGTNNVTGTPECQPGSKRCDSSARAVHTCDANGHWLTQACEFVCAEGACVGACLPGQRSCRDLTPQRCDDRGAWVPAGDPCAAQCIEGACSGACQEGSKQCVSSDQVQECRGGQWTQGSACPFACLDQGCGGECRPSDTRCASSTEMETCGAIGAWGFKAACDFVCSGKKCGGQCRPGAKRCASPTELQSCDSSGEWTGVSACAYACVNDACGGVCKPRTKRCGASGKTVETCSATGQWEAQSCPEACVDGACSSCTPGETECVSSSQVRACNAAGQWEAATTCANACVTNQCGGVCKPGARQCVGNASTPQYQICSASGQWGAATSCAPEPACKAGSCGQDPKLVFVTSSLYTGNLGGLSGADAKCNERARAAGLSGTFRAFLSDGTGSPATRFSKQGGPYRRVDNVVVAQNFNDLTANGLSKLINLTEKGSAPPAAKPPASRSDICGPDTSNLVWSNTLRSGSVAVSDGGCSNWTTTNSGKTNFGRFDDLQHWSSWCTSTGGDNPQCAAQAPLYCFEQ
ncbi:MAG TPA: hypothetical protein VFQ61_24570 [Polyangiaceae bacterium]|nr:hypothetical protein [Polyangiaceae bacterium]